MTVLMVQFSVDPGDVAEIESAVGKMCAALEDARLPGVRFAACKLADGVSFLNVLQLEDQTPNPLPGLEAAREFQRAMADRALGEQRPVAMQATVLGSFDLF